MQKKLPIQILKILKNLNRKVQSPGVLSTQECGKIYTYD